MENASGILNYTILSNDMDYINETSILEDFDSNYFLSRLREAYLVEIYGDYYKLSFCVTSVVCIFGYITNIFNVAVLYSTKMAHSMNLFLLVLSIAELFHISTQFSHIVHYFSGFNLFPNYQWVLFYIVNTYVETMFLYATNWLAVAIGVWRFVAITWPLQSRDWCSRGRAKKVIVLIFVLSAILATPVFAVITYSAVEFNSRYFYDKVFSEFALKNNGAFLKFYWSLLLFECFIPCIFLAALTIGLFKSLWKARTMRSSMRSSITIKKKSSPFKGSHRTTVMLTILLVLFVLSNFPDGCMVLLSIVTNGNEELSEDYLQATNIIRVFLLGNNCLAFFIYYGLGEGFRTRFHRLFCCCFVKKTLEDRDASRRKTMVLELTRSRTSTTSIYSVNSVTDNPRFCKVVSRPVTVL